MPIAIFQCSHRSINIYFSYPTTSVVFHRENEASLAVLPDLLMELDGMSEVCIVWIFYFYKKQIKFTRTFNLEPSLCWKRKWGWGGP